MKNANAKLLLVLCGTCWGLMWPMIKIGLSSMSPWSFRLIGFTVGALDDDGRRETQRPRSRGEGPNDVGASRPVEYLEYCRFRRAVHVCHANHLHGACRSCQLYFSGRTCLLAWLILGEKLRGTVALGLLLSITGLAVLIYPLLGSADVIGLSLPLVRH